MRQRQRNHVLTKSCPNSVHRPLRRRDLLPHLILSAFSHQALPRTPRLLFLPPIALPVFWRSLSRRRDLARLRAVRLSSVGRVASSSRVSSAHRRYFGPAPRGSHLAGDRPAPPADEPLAPFRRLHPSFSARLLLLDSDGSLPVLTRLHQFLSRQPAHLAPATRTNRSAMRTRGSRIGVGRAMRVTIHAETAVIARRGCQWIRMGVSGYHCGCNGALTCVQDHSVAVFVAGLAYTFPVTPSFTPPLSRCQQNPHHKI